MYQNNHIEVIEPDKGLYEECLSKGSSQTFALIASTVYKSYADIHDVMTPPPSTIPEITELSEVGILVDIMHKYIISGKRIAIVTDYDSDGINGAYILYAAMVKILGVNKDRIELIINRRDNGNGITGALLDTIKEEHNNNQIDMIITADHGSANGASIQELQSLGIVVCITDHHLIPKEDNAHIADAFVNPQKDKDSPFKYISGAAVAYFVMLHYSKKYGKWVDDQALRMAFIDLLPMVAISTVGDSMNMSNPLNRYLVHAGLDVMNQKGHPFWSVVSSILGLSIRFDHTVIGFKIVPLLNSASRMGNPDIAFYFYNSEKEDEIIEAYSELQKVNKQRQVKQKKLAVLADMQCFDSETHNTLTPILEDGLGINGIISSIIGARYYKPTVTFVQNGDAYNGSGRAINPNLNINGVFHKMDAIDPTIFERFGGHEGASGCTVYKDKIKDFKRLFEEEVGKELKDTNTQKIYKVFKSIKHEYIDEALVFDMENFYPLGVGFQLPYFFGKFYIYKIAYTSAKEEHMILTIRLDTGRFVKAIIFNYLQQYQDMEITARNYYYLVFTPIIDSFNNFVSFKFDIHRIIES